MRSSCGWSNSKGRIWSPRACGRRFHFKRHRRRSIVCRGILRELIGAYLQKDPSSLRFRYEPKGKPVLDEKSGEGLRFNLSHSEGIALLALTRRRKIGVDVEFLRPISDAKQIAERFFSPHERADLQSVTPQDQTVAFFNCWTRKKPYLKARGEGISRGLDQFCVSLVPGKPAGLMSGPWDSRKLNVGRCCRGGLIQTISGRWWWKGKTGNPDIGNGRASAPQPILHSTSRIRGPRFMVR